MNKNNDKKKSDTNIVSEDLLEGIGGGVSDRFSDIKTDRENVNYLKKDLEKVKIDLDIDKKSNLFGL